MHVFVEDVEHVGWLTDVAEHRCACGCGSWTQRVWFYSHADAQRRLCASETCVRVMVIRNAYAAADERAYAQAA